MSLLLAPVAPDASPDEATLRTLHDRIRALEAELRDARHAYRMLRTAAELFLHAGPSAVTWPMPTGTPRPTRSLTGA